MAALQIEGDIEGIQNVQIQFIRDVLEKRGFKDNKVVFEPTGQAGDNYIANVKRITVVNESGKDFKLIAKFAPEQEMMRALMNTGILFNNEAFMYGQVLPKLVSLQRAADVPEEDILRYAECYGCQTEEPNEVITLEDLKESDFVMLDRFTSLDDSAVRLIIKSFAVLHSLSFVLKKVEPNTYDSYKNKLIDMWARSNTSEDFKTFLVQLEDRVKQVVGDRYKGVFNGLVVQLPEHCTKVLKSESSSKNLIIQQGDGWTNNILFKLQDLTAIECVMIDYQLSREANPVCDLLYMVFNCTDHITRAKHYQDWMNYYHEELDRSLSNFGMKASFVYPRDQLDADLKRYSKINFALSVVLATMLTRKPEEAQQVTDAMKDYDGNIEKAVDLGQLSNDTVSLYKSRVEDLIDSYRLFGYL